MFHKLNGFIRDYNGTKYFALLGSEKYIAIFNWILHNTLFFVIFLVNFEISTTLMYSQKNVYELAKN